MEFANLHKFVLTDDPVDKKEYAFSSGVDTDMILFYNKTCVAQLTF